MLSGVLLAIGGVTLDPVAEPRHLGLMAPRGHGRRGATRAAWRDVAVGSARRRRRWRVVVVRRLSPLKGVIMDRLEEGKSDAIREQTTEQTFEIVSLAPITGYGTTRSALGSNQTITAGRISSCPACGNAVIGSNGYRSSCSCRPASSARRSSTCSSWSICGEPAGTSRRSRAASVRRDRPHAGGRVLLRRGAERARVPDARGRAALARAARRR